MPTRVGEISSTRPLHFILPIVGREAMPIAQSAGSSRGGSCCRKPAEAVLQGSGRIALSQRSRETFL